MVRHRSDRIVQKPILLCFIRFVHFSFVLWDERDFCINALMSKLRRTENINLNKQPKDHIIFMIVNRTLWSYLIRRYSTCELIYSHYSHSVLWYFTICSTSFGIKCNAMFAYCSSILYWFVYLWQDTRSMHYLLSCVPIFIDSFVRCSFVSSFFSSVPIIIVVCAFLLCILFVAQTNNTHLNFYVFTYYHCEAANWDRNHKFTVLESMMRMFRNCICAQTDSLFLTPRNSMFNVRVFFLSLSMRAMNTKLAQSYAKWSELKTRAETNIVSAFLWLDLPPKQTSVFDNATSSQTQRIQIFFVQILYVILIATISHVYDLSNLSVVH